MLSCLKEGGRLFSLLIYFWNLCMEARRSFGTPEYIRFSVFALYRQIIAAVLHCRLKIIYADMLMRRQKAARLQDVSKHISDIKDINRDFSVRRPGFPRGCYKLFTCHNHITKIIATSTAAPAIIAPRSSAAISACPLCRKRRTSSARRLASPWTNL